MSSFLQKEPELELDRRTDETSMLKLLHAHRVSDGKQRFDREGTLPRFDVRTQKSGCSSSQDRRMANTRTRHMAMPRFKGLQRTEEGLYCQTVQS